MSSDRNWCGGLKTLPNEKIHRTTRASRWDLDNSKTIDDVEKSSRQRSRSAPLDNWTSGQKILEDRYVSSPHKSVHSQKSDDTWHGTNKRLPNSTHSSMLEGSWWHTENFKTLRNSPQRRLERSLDPWSSGHKLLPNKRTRRPDVNCYPRAQLPVARSVSEVPLGNWSVENFKILGRQCEDDRRYARDDQWMSGLKTVEQEDPLNSTRRGLQAWHTENEKVLENRRHRSSRDIVYANVGWDSGLYKTFGPQQRRAYAANDEWAANRKAFARGSEESYQSRRVTGRNPGWDSGLKTIPSAPRAPTAPPSRDHWDAENTKTLPPSYQFASCHNTEYQRYVQEPRRRDMRAFHERLCGHQSRFLY
eukprot:TRINITY_DN7821_c0_g1_i1.p1 TRINITY_DN7821_c0_g1~~TRINITY_DN7821_c0_g1_i1.p1  ORF type:complete len:380 (-),score=26.86 TRINITY_DN7821_c0_g1_i1:126-1211(-)